MRLVTGQAWIPPAHLPPVAAFLDALEGRIRRAHHRRVDADHAAFQRIADAVGGAGVFREGVSGKAVGQAVGLLDHLVEGAERGGDDDGAARLLVHQPDRHRHVGQYGRLEEEAFFAMAFAGGADAGPVLHRIGDEALDRLGPARIGHRPHVHAAVQTVADRGDGQPGGGRIDEAIVDPLLHVEAGGETQTCSALRILATASVSTARSRSQSSNRITGAWSPSSIVVRFIVSVHSRIRCLPTAVEPVKLSLRMIGLASR
jgi:hypothetical protein